MIRERGISMRYLLLIALIIAAGYFSFGRRSSSPPPPAPAEETRPIIGGASITSERPEERLSDPGENRTNSDPRPDPSTEGTGPGTTAEPRPASTRLEETGIVPALGEDEPLLERLRRAVVGKTSPDGDEARLRLASACFEAGEIVEGTRALREIIDGGGTYAPRASAALLPRSEGEERSRLAAAIITAGPDAPGYDDALIVHTAALIADPAEASQLEAWKLLSAAYFAHESEAQRRPLRERLDPLVRKWILSPRPCSLTQSYTVIGGDSLDRIAKSQKTTIDQLVAVNRLDSDLIHPGDRLKVLDRPIRIEVDKSEFRLDVLYDGGYLMSFPIGHGSDGRTPSTTFEVNLRQKHPTWFPPNQPSVPYGDPANPLGERWLGFESADGFRGFGIHGTNEPETIGLEASEGCIRLVNEDVVALYPFVAIGTRVTIRD
jgi:lipoprotein-anchoring transpeptidase ErfK/SrfK